MDKPYRARVYRAPLATFWDEVLVTPHMDDWSKLLWLKTCCDQEHSDRRKAESQLEDALFRIDLLIALHDQRQNEAVRLQSVQSWIKWFDVLLVLLAFVLAAVIIVAVMTLR